MKTVNEALEFFEKSEAVGVEAVKCGKALAEFVRKLQGGCVMGRVSVGAGGVRKVLITLEGMRLEDGAALYAGEASPASVRAAALEEAAQVAESTCIKDPFKFELGTEAAKAIRALSAAPAGGMGEVSAAARDVLAERRRQQEVEGWTPEHDDQHDDGELAIAASCYAMCAAAPTLWAKRAPLSWPWSDQWWKPAKDPRRNLEKAGALILAEIDRLDRIAAAQGEGK